MDGGSRLSPRSDTAGQARRAWPEGAAKLPPRALDGGMGMAVGRRTVFRPEDGECFGRVADRVVAGNSALGAVAPGEAAGLRDAIATGALLTSGRHLQHGDADQPGRNMEVFTNCATAATSFAKFYLLLNGSGVGRSYDDALVAVDWAEAPELRLYLSPTHRDYPRDRAGLLRFGTAMGILPWGATEADFDAAAVQDFLARELLPDLGALGEDAVLHSVADSREGWAKAVEILESMAFAGARGRVLAIDLSAVRPAGAPIRGMQNRPASGPVSLLRGLLALRREVIGPARARDPQDEALQPWEQALLADHHLSVEVQVGGGGGGGGGGATPPSRRAWRPSPGATRASCASSAPSPRAGCGRPTIR